MLACAYKFTRRYNPENQPQYLHRRENLESGWLAGVQSFKLLWLHERELVPAFGYRPVPINSLNESRILIINFRFV
jgi:hypothetical protein